MQLVLMEIFWRCVLAFAVVAVLVPLCFPLAHRLGLYDVPGGRKQHDAPTLYVGGIFIVVAVALSFLIFDRKTGLSASTFLAGSFLLALVGFLDDFRGLSARTRFAFQITVALMIIYVAHIQVENLGDVFGVAYVRLGWLAAPFTVFAVVGVINALNMIDGSDGLAGGLALTALLLFSAFALYAGNLEMVARLLTVAAAVTGFLLWNMRFPWQPRARVFLGNAGSMVLGFVIAWAAVRLTQNTAHPVSPVLGPWVVAIPLIDCITLAFRRIRQGNSPFKADRNHIHHLLLDAGFSVGTIAWGLMGLSFALGIGAGAAVQQGIYRPLLVVAFIGLLGGYFQFTRDRQRAVARLGRFRIQLGGKPGVPFDAPSKSDSPGFKTLAEP